MRFRIIKWPLGFITQSCYIKKNNKEIHQNAIGTKNWVCVLKIIYMKKKTTTATHLVELCVDTKTRLFSFISTCVVLHKN